MTRLASVLRVTSMAIAGLVWLALVVQCGVVAWRERRRDWTLPTFAGLLILAFGLFVLAAAVTS